MMSGQTMTRNRPDDRGHASGARISRQDSASQGKWSNDVICVVESGTVDEIRQKVAEGLRIFPESLLRQSMKNEHYLRTPLMAAAASGDFSLFTTVMHAVDNAIEKTAGRQLSKAELETRQLTMKDSMGMTLAMVAAEGGMVPIIRAVLRRITDAKDQERLVDSDYRGNTVLLHAAGAGKSATFDAFVQAIEESFPQGEVQEQLQTTSGNGWNILMHAARCGDQLGVTAVISTCRIYLSPSKVRGLVEEVDVDGMTFLMHATSSSTVELTDAEQTAVDMRQRRANAAEKTSAQAIANLSMAGYTRSHAGPAVGSFHGIAEEEEEEEEGEERGGDVETGGFVSPAERAQAGARGAFFGGFGSSSTPQKQPLTTSMVAPGDEAIAEAPAAVKETTDPSLVVFKTSWAMVEEVLWKGQLRKQLKLKDTWGRNLLIHAVQSGRVQIFEAAFSAMREHILDPETNALMNVDEDDNVTSMMEAALDAAPDDVVTLVKRRDQELKKTIALDERASTIESKMQSFIPGKLIVIFQLLLPEMGSGGTGPLVLLLLLTLMAPMLTWATTLLSRDKPVLEKDSRHSIMTNLLSAPAIFFWGLGTSDIGPDSLGWSETASAAALAVATIIIPGLDAFFANQRVEQWFDKWSGQSWSFSKKAHLAWLKETKKLRGQKQSRERMRSPPGDKKSPYSTSWACGGLCQKLDATGVVEAAAGAESSWKSTIGEGNNAATRAMAGAMEEKEGFFDDVEKQGHDLAAMARTWVPAPFQALFGDGSNPATGAMDAKDRMMAMADKQRQDMTARARSTAAGASEVLIGGGKAAVTAAMQEKDRMFAMAENQRQGLTDRAAGARSSVADASGALLGDGKDAVASAMQEKGKMFAMAENQRQGLVERAATARASAAGASETFVGDGKDAMTAAMHEKERMFAMAENQRQGLTAGARSSATYASEALRSGGENVATGATREKERLLAMVENQGQNLAAVADSSVPAPLQAFFGDGKDAVAAAMEEKDSLFAMAEDRQQQLAAGARSSMDAASQALSDGKDTATATMQEQASVLAIAETTRQELTAGVRSSAAGASGALLGLGEDAATSARQEKEIMFAMAERQRQDLTVGARLSAADASEALVGGGKEAATAAMLEKDRMFAMADKERQDLTAVARSSAAAVSQSLLGDGIDAATEAIEDTD